METNLKKGYVFELISFIERLFERDKKIGTWKRSKSGPRFTSGTVGERAKRRERRTFQSIANRSDPESRLQINARGAARACVRVHGTTWPLSPVKRGCRRRIAIVGPTHRYRPK